MRIDPLGVFTGNTANGMPRTTSTWRERYGPGSMREHHLIPQSMLNNEAFMQQMKNAGIKNPTNYIHRQISRIPNKQHSDVHKNGWNEQWKTWFKQNPNFTKLDLQRNMKNMMNAFNIQASSRNFSKNMDVRGNTHESKP